jgi:hypothetical protein
VPTGFAEELHEQVGAAVDHRRRPVEARRAVDHPEYPHDPLDPLEIAELGLERRQDRDR